VSIYNHLDYRDILSQLVKDRRAFEPRFGFHKLAEAARIQKPYMSKVMGLTANLSQDQLFRICQFLTLSEAESEYMHLCLEHARTGVSDRQLYLKKKIDAIAEKHRDSSQHLKAKVVSNDASMNAMSDYYLDPMVQLVHVALAIPRYSKDPMSLAEDLSLDGPQMHAIVSSLEKSGLIVRDGKALLPREMTLHLAKTSPLYKAWRNQLKLLSMHKINTLGTNDSTYSFSTVFTATESTRKKIHEQFLEFLKGCEQDVTSGTPRNLYQMSFDLFSWSPLN